MGFGEFAALDKFDNQGLDGGDPGGSCGEQNAFPFRAGNPFPSKNCRLQDRRPLFIMDTEGSGGPAAGRDKRINGQEDKG